MTRAELLEALTVERFAPGPRPPVVAPVARVERVSLVARVERVPLVALDDPGVIAHRRWVLEHLDDAEAS